MVDGEGVVELFVAEFVHGLLFAENPRHAHPDEVVDHGGQQDGHEVVFPAPAVERLVEIV